MTSTTTPANIRIQALSIDTAHLFTTADVARLFSFSEDVVSAMEKDGTGPKFFNTSQGIRYRHVDLEMWIGERVIETRRTVAAANKPASRANTFASRAQR